MNNSDFKVFAPNEHYIVVSQSLLFGCSLSKKVSLHSMIPEGYKVVGVKNNNLILTNTVEVKAQKSVFKNEAGILEEEYNHFGIPTSECLKLK